MELHEILCQLSSYCAVLPSSEADANKYGRDKGPIASESDFLVAFPESAPAVQQILSVCHDANIPVTPRGAGSGLTGGAVPLHGGVLLSFERMNRILAFDAELGLVTVEPGMITGDLQRYLEERGFFFPPAPNSQDISSIGGNFFHNASGPRSFKHGAFGEFVLGARVVCMDGTLLSLGSGYSRGFVGYNLASLMLGSEGTLALAVEITLKILPLPENRVTLLVETDSVEDAASVAERIGRNSRHVSALDLIGGGTSHCLRSAIPDFPLRKADPSLILVEIEGSELDVGKQLSSVRQRLYALERICVHEVVDAGLQANVWRARRNLFLCLKQSYPDMAVEDVCVPPGEVSAILRYIRQRAAAHGIEWRAIGNIGEGNLHLGVINSGMVGTGARQAFFKEVIAEACVRGGAISFEHGIAAKKKGLFTQLAGADLIRIHKGLKAVFDPKHLLNPGKMFEDMS